MATVQFIITASVPYGKHVEKYCHLRFANIVVIVISLTDKTTLLFLKSLLGSFPLGLFHAIQGASNRIVTWRKIEVEKVFQLRSTWIVSALFNSCQCRERKLELDTSRKISEKYQCPPRRQISLYGMTSTKGTSKITCICNKLSIRRGTSQQFLVSTCIPVIDTDDRGNKTKSCFSAS